MKKYVLLSFILFYFSAKAQIQFSSFQEVLSYADANAFAIKSAAIGEQIALAEKREAKSNLLPNLNVSLGYNDNITLQPTLVPAQLVNPAASDGTFEELTFGTRYQYSWGIQAQWDVLNFQKIFAAQTAGFEAEASKVNTEINRFNTYNQLASTYYSIILTQASIQIYEENVAVADSISEHANEKHRKGIISEADLNRATIRKLQNQSSLNMAKHNLDQFYLQFQSQLNTDEHISVNDRPEKFVLEEPSIRAVHPEVIRQQLEVGKYQSMLKQMKALRYPTLSFVYQNNRIWATNSFMDFSNANELPQQFFGVKINMSGLFSPATKQKINQSQGRLQLQQLQLENTQFVKQKEDELLQLQFEQASDQLVEKKQMLNLQEQIDVHAENKYQIGIISLDQRLDIYDDLLIAQDAYLQSLAALTLAQYKIYVRQFDFQLK